MPRFIRAPIMDMTKANAAAMYDIPMAVKFAIPSLPPVVFVQEVVVPMFQNKFHWYSRMAVV